MTLCPGSPPAGHPCPRCSIPAGATGEAAPATPFLSSLLALQHLLLLLTAFRTPALHLLVTCSRQLFFPQTAFFKVYCLQGPAVSTSCPFPSPLSPVLSVTPLPPRCQTMDCLSVSAVLTLVPLLGRCSVNTKLKEIALDATEKFFMLTEALIMKLQEPRTSTCGLRNIR